MAEMKIRIIEVKEVKTNDGRKFNAYKALTKHGEKMDVKFTQECNLTPKEPCVIVVDPLKANVSTRKIFPVLWVKEVIRIEENVRTSNVGDYFGEDEPEIGEDAPLSPSESNLGTNF